MKLLLIEDDLGQAEAVRIAFELLDPGSSVLHLGNGAMSVAVIKSERPDVVLLDLGLPGEDGISVLERIRAASDVPLIVVSGRNNPSTVVRALKLGADDYITKPFHAIELQARVQAVLRRAEHAGDRENTYRGNGVEIDFDRKFISIAGSQLELSRQEWGILSCLWYNRSKVVDRNLLKSAVWAGDDISESAIFMAVSRLRHKLGPAAELVQSHRGSGYVFNVPPVPV